ncbi:MAG: ATP-binding cassette domain-containing protein [Paludibacteraceae bacterium]|nr:ATP-binding cassette domain-containing protein [Paludibacteraceae bacterium]
MIKFDNVSVSFPDKKGQIVDAVKNVSFEIGKGEIFGIVGASGAGKSTLLRTVNQLQRTTGGRTIVDGSDIGRLSGPELASLRHSIGMIFQQFNLVSTKTVAQNVAFAMEIAGRSREKIKQRVPELLELVGLTERAEVYPNTLSGGQKQRVGIARAVANNPKILLCDEATSALDPETTNDVLQLLKEINRKFGITIVLITHELDVVKKICQRVAVMDKGEVVEIGEVFDVFTKPQHEFTKALLSHTFDLDLPERLTSDPSKPLVKIIYNGDKAEDSIVSNVVKHYAVDVNILHGKIEYINDKPFGILIVQLIGAQEELDKSLDYLRKNTYRTEVINERN